MGMSDEEMELYDATSKMPKKARSSDEPGPAPGESLRDPIDGPTAVPPEDEDKEMLTEIEYYVQPEPEVIDLPPPTREPPDKEKAKLQPGRWVQGAWEHWFWHPGAEKTPFEHRMLSVGRKGTIKVVEKGESPGSWCRMEIEWEGMPKETHRFVHYAQHWWWRAEQDDPDPPESE